MNYPQALNNVIAGLKVTRRGWNGAGQTIEAQLPDANSKMTRPYIFITTVQGDRIPWLCSQGDAFAEDWEVA
jgi:hypothetical protein